MNLSEDEFFSIPNGFNSLIDDELTLAGTLLIRDSWSNKRPLHFIEVNINRL